MLTERLKPGARLRRRLLGNYEIGRLLGEGSFGLVYEASPVGSDKRVALKQITKLGVRREEILQGKGGGTDEQLRFTIGV